MATWYVDKNVASEGDGTTWAKAVDAVNDVWALGATEGDTVLIKSYGPDDPYTASDSSRLINNAASGREGMTFIGDDGTGSASAPEYRLCWLDGSGSNAGVALRPATLYYLAFSNCTNGFQVTSETEVVEIHHCRFDTCSTRALAVSAGGNFVLEWTELLNNSNEDSITGTGKTFDVQHNTWYSNGGTSGVVRFNDIDADDGSVTFLNNLLLGNTDTADLVIVSELAHWASGSPDYNHTDDVANGAAMYSPNTSPSNDKYNTEVDTGEYLPHASPFDILYPTRGCLGERAGSDGLDIGAHSNEYIVEGYPVYSAEMQAEATNPERSEDPQRLRVGTDSSEVFRAAVTFDVENIPAETVVKESWFTFDVSAVSGDATTDGGALDVHPYAGLGYDDDPETDGDSSITDMFHYCDDGPVLADDLDYGCASSGAAGTYATLLDPDYVNTLLEEARRKQETRFSLGLRLDAEGDDHIEINGTGCTDATEGPRLLTIYRQPPTVEQMLRSAKNYLQIALST